VADSEVTYRSASEMARLVASRKISPVELVDQHLEQIENLQPKLNAFATVDGEGARRQARAAEAAVERRHPLGPLHGVPISIKSSIAVAGLPWEAGTRLRQGMVAEEDAVLVARLRRAGAIILGTTNLPEMLMAYESNNALYGRTNNPWDLARTAGGSSGGESAAVAAGCSAAGVGSDSGGSIRIPAHFTGICGLKGTPGRIPGTGHYPECLGPFSLLGAVGPMTRTVDDLELMMQIMAGADAGDVGAHPVPLGQIADADLRRLRIGYFEQDDQIPATAETRAAVRDCAEALRQEGFEVVPFRLKNLDAAKDVWTAFFTQSGGMLLREMYAGHEDTMSPILREFMERAAALPSLTGERLLAAWLRRDQLRSQMMEQMQSVPVFLCPVCSIPAFRHGEREWNIDGNAVEYFQAMSYTQWFNVLGNPCVVVPAAQSKEGLPIGIQIVARPWEEHVAIGVAKYVERLLGWKQPPLTASPRALSLSGQSHRS
jgi:Asp-tRNA(Asn)/Glu-tRNA(Gln) amidotransferase A subunit family amidase